MRWKGTRGSTVVASGRASGGRGLGRECKRHLLRTTRIFLHGIAGERGYKKQPVQVNWTKHEKGALRPCTHSSARCKYQFAVRMISARGWYIRVIVLLFLHVYDLHIIHIEGQRFSFTQKPAAADTRRMETCCSYCSTKHIHRTYRKTRKYVSITFGCMIP